MANYFLKKKQVRISRKREMKNLSKTGSVLILLSAEEDEIQGALRLSAFLKAEGKMVFALCYNQKSKQKTIDNYQIAEIKIFNKHHLNWFYTPSDELLAETVKREFDLLVDLSAGNSFPLKYLHTMSRSALKTGSARGYIKECADMTIELPEDKGPDFLISQLKHYLTRIN